MPGRLDGKRAFVTSAAAGIGRACALAFAAEGARVLATDIDERGLEALRGAGIETARLDVLRGAGIETARLDVLDSAAVQAIATQAGDVDVLLNAAGFVHHGTALDCSEDDWDASFDLNVKSMHRTLRAFLPGMLARGRGAIVNIASSVAASKAAPNRYVYAATKGAVVALTRSVALDFVTRGIRCNCICPGTIETPSLHGRIQALGGDARQMFIARQPLGRLGTPEEVAAVAVHLAGDESAFTTGIAYVVDGGFTL